MKHILYIIALLVFTTFVSCKKKAKEPEPVPAEEEKTGTLKIGMDHIFGAEDFVLNSTNFYITDLNDSLKFTAFKYYISNIKLKKSDGTYWEQADSYYLVNCAEAASLTLVISGVPHGNYSELTYSVGIDSTHNVSGAQSGALATTNGMFWSWNSGYIFMKAEGSYQNGSNTGNFEYHIGGFKNSTNTNAVQQVSHDLSGDNIKMSDHGTKAHIMVDLATLFNGGPNDINVVSTPTVHMPGASAVSLSQNYKAMFTLDHLHQ